MFPVEPMTPSVRVRVPAKINLALVVGPPRGDGYHPLSTVFQAVSLYDEVTATVAAPGQLTCSVTGEGAAEVPADGSNLAVRAVRRMLEVLSPHDVKEMGAHLEIRKGIPVAGGMAGGSADAAAALLATSVLWDVDMTPDDLREVGADVGSDVPFSLLGGIALGTGRGEQLVPCLSRGTYHWVLVVSHEGLSTSAVYRRFDELGLAASTLEPPPGMMAALASGDPHALAPLLRNDLQAAATDLRPDLLDTLEAGAEAGALAGIVSGSGPTCAFLAADESSAISLSASLSGAGVGRMVRRVTGPVAGARLLT